MAEKRVSVRLAATGGRQVRAELEGVGEAGKRGFGRLNREMEAANKRLAGFARRVRGAAAAAVAAATAAGIAMVRSGLQTGVARHGQVSDYTAAAALLGSLPTAEWLIADRGYYVDWFLAVRYNSGPRGGLCSAGPRGHAMGPTAHDRF